MKRIALSIKRLLALLSVAIVGFVVGVLALYTLWVRSGPPLELWHTAELTAEFTEKMTGEVQSFDDYRRLEDALFAQLDDRVYAKTEVSTRNVMAGARNSADSQRSRL